MLRKLYKWYWSVENQEWDLRLPFGKTKATVWPNGVWHTWDSDLCGGENSICELREYRPYEDWHHQAKREAFKSCIEQGFIK
jgi:hypothetical protein